MKRINLSNLENFFVQDIWLLPRHGASRIQGIAVGALQVLWLSIREFIRDRCGLKAASLTLYTLLAIVPLIAMAVAIAKGFGYSEFLEKEIVRGFEGHQQVADYALQSAQKLIKETKGGTIATYGFILLLYSTMSLLYSIEEIFTEIWALKKSRSLGRKFTDYLAILLIAPFFILTASSVSTYIFAGVSDATSSVSVLKLARPFIFFLLKMGPIVLLWIAFSLFYNIMPYTKVSLKASLIAGIFAGTLFFLVQWGYIAFQIGVSRYNAIYGGFAALPLFLIWLQFVWFIVLFGAELSYAIQNVRLFSFAKGQLKISIQEQHVISLAVCQYIQALFLKGEKPQGLKGISENLGIPSLYVHRLLHKLTKAKLLLSGKDEQTEETFYTLHTDPERYTIAYIMNNLESYGQDRPKLPDNAVLRDINERIHAFRNSLEQHPLNINIKDLTNINKPKI
ncbi:MAG: YihY family inner membrane protein [Cytophagales bacterium]|nr:YihY family inner membrane protein [Cytophagales bacterium]